MSQEWRALIAAGLTKRNNTSLQRGVTWWLAFKVAVLEEGSAIASGLDELHFRERALAHLKRKGPTNMRGSSSSTSKRLRSDCVTVWWHYYALLCAGNAPLEARRDSVRGVGLFVRTSPWSWAQLAHWSQGYVCQVSTTDYALLLQHGYPSLVAPYYILFGPLALVNHSCGSPLCLSPPLQQAAAADDGLFCGFCVMQIECSNANASAVTSSSGEIVVNYMLVRYRLCGTPANCQCFSSH